MRRLSRRSRGNRSQKRKSYWTGFTFSGGQIELNNAQDGEVVCAWAKWPSGTTSFQQGDTNSGQFITPNDETLVRTINSMNCTLNLQGVIQSSFEVTAVLGLITWDAQTPADIEAIISEGLVPNPARQHGLDWITRLPFSFTRDNFSIGNIAETFIVSRAMRKLPPNTGILCCFGYEALLGSPELNLSFDFQLDTRMLFKAGYYSA